MTALPRIPAVLVREGDVLNGHRVIMTVPSAQSVRLILDPRTGGKPLDRANGDYIQVHRDLTASRFGGPR